MFYLIGILCVLLIDVLCLLLLRIYVLLGIYDMSCVLVIVFMCFGGLCVMCALDFVFYVFHCALDFVFYAFC